MFDGWTCTVGGGGGCGSLEISSAGWLISGVVETFKFCSSFDFESSTVADTSGVTLTGGWISEAVCSIGTDASYKKLKILWTLIRFCIILIKTIEISDFKDIKFIFIVN